MATSGARQARRIITFTHSAQQGGMISKPMRVYFFCRNEKGNLQEDVITLAEGFRELGVPYFANCNYWQQSTAPDDFLFRNDPATTPDDCDVVVVSYTWPYWIRMNTFEEIRRPLPEGLFKPGRKYRTVYMDSHDGHCTVSWEPKFRQFDLILRSKLNRRSWHPGNMRPWVLGFSNRILEASRDAPTFAQRRKRILFNFGASHPYPHGTRELARKRFEPAISRILPIDATKDDLSVEPSDSYDGLMWRQTGSRFSRSYYERLKHSQAVACFCGEMIPPMPFRKPEHYLVGGNKAKLRRMIYDILAVFDPRPPRSVQWDSFRFWETLAAGAVAFNVDLEHYGVKLPVMPENWKHYIGVDFDRVDETLERIQADPDCLERIAAAGHTWAMQHYSPKAMASRFIEEVGFSIKNLNTKVGESSSRFQ
jgi:hypothetical protein